MVSKVSGAVVAICMLAWCLPVQAQQYNFTATVSKQKVAVGSYFNLEYAFEGGRPQEFTPPDLSAFRLQGPPTQGSQTNIVNTSISHTYTFTYTLSPRKEGKYTIGPATIRIKNQKFESNSVDVTVVAKGKENNDINQQIAEGLYMRTFLSKKKVYLGEQVKLSYKLYKKVDLSNLAPNQTPSYEGFWKEVIASPDQLQLQNEVINGVRYQTGIVESVILFPQKTGKITIEPYILDSRVPVRTKRQGNYDPFFDNFFGGGITQYDYQIVSPQVVLEVLPLPSKGKPVGFSGLVGQFDFKAELTSRELDANESVTLNIVVNGKGNLKLLKPWQIDLPADIEVYDAKTHDKFSKSSGTFSGQRRYEYLMIPRREGTFKLPPIMFSYFDVSKEQYVTFNADDLSIKVGKGEGLNQQAGSNISYTKEEVGLLNEDIRFIHTKSIDLKEKQSFLFNSITHYSLASLPFGLFIFGFWYRKKQAADEKDVVSTNKRKATSIAKKSLTEAKKHLDANSKEQFYTEISQALYGFLGNKYAIKPSELSKENVLKTLNSNGVEAQLQERITSLIDTCEYVRFAPGMLNADMQTVYNNAVDIITQLEANSK